MLSNSKRSWLILCCTVAAAPAFAVDLVGVHDLALKNDPKLRAAEFRREATHENKTQAWANLLPELGANGAMTRGGTKTTIAGNEISDVDTDNERYGLELRQSLYRQANYENLDIARGQISQAEAVYRIAFQDFLLRVAERYFLVLATTLRRLIFGLMPFWGDGSGQIRYTGIAFPPVQLMCALLPVLRGRPRPWMSEPCYVSRTVDDITITTGDPLVIDGEFVQPEPDVPVLLRSDREALFVRL